MKVEIKKALKIGEKAFTAPVQVYENYAEILKDARSEAAVVNMMNNWLHAHGSAGEVRDLIVDIVEEVSGVKPTVTTKKNKAGKEVKVKEDPMDFVLRTVGVKPELFDKVQAMLTTKAGKGYTWKDPETGKTIDIKPIRVDASETPKGTGKPKKLADKWKEVATMFISGGKNLDKFNKALKGAGLNEFTFAADKPKNDPANVEALGWLCKAYQDSQDAFKNM